MGVGARNIHSEAALSRNIMEEIPITVLILLPPSQCNISN